MPKTTDWRTQGASDALKDLDRSDLAWEFLRRNPDYQEDYRKALQRIALGAVTEEAAMADISRRWGLSFRPRSRSASDPPPVHLAARALAADRRPRPRAGVLLRGA